MLPGVKGLAAFGRDIKAFFDFQRHVLYSPTYDPAVVPLDNFNEEGSVAVWNSGGRYKLKVDEFVALQKLARPDFVACIADVQTSQVSLKRQRKCVTRSLELLDHAIKLWGEQNVPGKLFGVICGGPFEGEREKSAVETAKRDVAGFAIEGFGTGESPEARKRLLDIVISHLPADKPRVISNILLPEDTLDAVAAGVDIFDTVYPTVEAELGCALLFDFGSDLAAEHAPPRKLELWGAEFKQDFAPILQGCQCYACRRHTRAYIHHLLNVHEMLGTNLLMTHNLHHYMRFFAAIRRSIADQRFAESCAEFKRVYVA